MFRKKHILILFLGVFLSVCGGWFYTSQASNENIYLKIDKGLFYLKEVFQAISRNYVDEIDPRELSKSAIDGMLKEFDPYTVFFEDPGSQQMRMITRGRYGGVGMEIGIRNNRITVITPMEDSPAKKAGIQAGDIILKVDGQSVEGKSLEKVSNMLRGKVGTKVTIEIERTGLDKPLVIELTRDEIVLKDVTFADFIEPGTAYFRLSAFSDKAAKELKSAIRKLQAKGTIERVILDLRGNPGGLLTSAVEIANIFLPPGELVVSTRGFHEEENKFFTQEMPLLPTQPLVVLVNQSSASASEIVSGAIQDLDRGVLVGTETFGKGLVQKVFPIDKVSQAYLKITTAKYYIPSGRSIQKEDYKKNTRLFVNLSDSVEYNQKIDYYTKNGRIVHGGGGIKPDINVKGKNYDAFLYHLIARGYLFMFTVDYLSRHPELKHAPQLVINEAMVKEFQDFVTSKNFDYQAEGEDELTSFLEIARKNKYDPDIQDLVTVALQKLRADKSHQFERHHDLIAQFLEAEFAEQIKGNTERIRVMLKYDEQLKKALTVLHNMEQYQELLAIRDEK